MYSMIHRTCYSAAADAVLGALARASIVKSKVAGKRSLYKWSACELKLIPPVYTYTCVRPCVLVSVCYGRVLRY